MILSINMMSSPAFPYSRRRHVTPVAGMPALEARSLCAGYEDSPDVALRNVDLCVPVGARVALVGPNVAIYVPTSRLSSTPTITP